MHRMSDGALERNKILRVKLLYVAAMLDQDIVRLQLQFRSLKDLAVEVSMQRKGNNGLR